MNCVNIRVKKEKLRDSVMRSAGGSGSNSACGLNTRLKNCAGAPEATQTHAASRQHTASGQRVRCEPEHGQRGDNAAHEHALSQGLGV